MDVLPASLDEQYGDSLPEETGGHENGVQENFSIENIKISATVMTISFASSKTLISDGYFYLWQKAFTFSTLNNKTTILQQYLLITLTWKK